MAPYIRSGEYLYMKFRNYVFLPYNKNNNAAVKLLRNNMTDEEKKLWYQYLRAYPIRFIRQKAVDNFIMDFYCAKCRLCVEIDGAQHSTESGKGHDEARTKILNAYGIDVIRFDNDQIRNHFFQVCNAIDQRVKELVQTRLV